MAVFVSDLGTDIVASVLFSPMSRKIKKETGHLLYISMAKVMVSGLTQWVGYSQKKTLFQ